jgi:glucose-1-phosphate adenylyltransferase
MEHESWYQGTADAVRRNIPYFTERSYDLVLILSGDQLYRMDFQEMVRTHQENKAAVTIAALPVTEKDASSCGVMRIEADGRVVDFEEKPKTAEKLGRVRTDPNWLAKLGLNAAGRPYLASMGIYLFNRSLLVDLLRASNATDFGHELLPSTIHTHRVQAHLFDDYWEDIGTVGAVHKANIDLTRDDPAFDFASEAGPIFTRPRFLPCSRVAGATFKNSLICDGSVIGRGSVIENSVIGVRARIAENVTIRDTYIMGIDYPEFAPHRAENERLNRPNLGIGANSVIEHAIIDKNARIGRNDKILNKAGNDGPEEFPTHVIRDGIVVTHKLITLPDGAVI